MKIIVNKKDLAIISFRHDDIAEDALKKTIESNNRRVAFWDDEAKKDPTDTEANEQFKSSLMNNFVLMTSEELKEARILKEQAVQ